MAKSYAEYAAEQRKKKRQETITATPVKSNTSKATASASAKQGQTGSSEYREAQKKSPFASNYGYALNHKKSEAGSRAFSAGAYGVASEEEKNAPRKGMSYSQWAASQRANNGYNVGTPVTLEGLARQVVDESNKRRTENAKNEFRKNAVNALGLNGKPLTDTGIQKAVDRANYEYKRQQWNRPGVASNKTANFAMNQAQQRRGLRDTARTMAEERNEKQARQESLRRQSGREGNIIPQKRQVENPTPVREEPYRDPNIVSFQTRNNTINERKDSPMLGYTPSDYRQEVDLRRIRDDAQDYALNRQKGAESIFDPDEQAMIDRTIKGISPVDYMTNEEKQNYDYLVGKYGINAAKAYEQRILPEANRRMTEAFVKEQYDTAKANPLKGIKNDLVDAFWSGEGALQAGVNLLNGDQTDYNSLSFLGSRGQSASHSGVIDAAKENFGDNIVTNILAEGGLSVLENAARYPFGSAGIAVMGMEAATGSMIEAKERGASDEQAFAYGVTAGIVEYLTEEVSLGNLQGIAKFTENPIRAFKDLALALATNAGVEASEEMASEILDYAADYFVMGENSKHLQRLREYMSQGMSENEAKLAVFADLMKDTAMAGTIGAVSGVGMAGPVATFNYGMNVANERRIDQARRASGDDMEESTHDMLTRLAAEQDRPNLAEINEWARNRGEYLDYKQQFEDAIAEAEDSEEAPGETPADIAAEAPAEEAPETDEQLRAMAEEQAALKESQRDALVKAGRNQDKNFRELMDSATMLSEDEKVEALFEGNRQMRDAAEAEVRTEAAQMAAENQEQNWETLEPVEADNYDEEGNYVGGEEEGQRNDLLGEGSERVLSQSSGEGPGGISSASRVSETTSRGLGEGAADDGARDIRYAGEEQGEAVLASAVKGQKVYKVDLNGPLSAPIKKGIAILKAMGIKEVIPFASWQDVLVDTGEYVRAAYDPVRQRIVGRVNNEKTTFEHLARHESVEMGIDKGKVKVSDTMDFIRSELESNDLADAVPLLSKLARTYVKSVDLSDPNVPTDVKTAALQEGIKELICDAGGGINQFAGVKGYEAQAELMDAIISIAEPYINEKLDYAFDAEYDGDSAIAENVEVPVSDEESEIAGDGPKATVHSVDSFVTAGGFKAVKNEDNITYQIINPMTGEEVTEDDVTVEIIDKTPVGTMINAALEAKTISPEVAAKQKEFAVNLMKMLIRYKDKPLVWEFAGSTLFSTIKKNADSQYGSTVDFGTICAKTQALIDVMSELMVRKKRGLTRNEVLKVYDSVAKVRGKDGKRLSVPCPVCYVFSRWMGVPSLLETMRRGNERFGNDAKVEDVDRYVKRIEKKYSITRDAEGKVNKKKLTSAKSALVKKAAALEGEWLKARDNPARMAEIEEEINKIEKDLEDISLYNWVTFVRCKSTAKGVPILDSNGSVQLDPKYHVDDDTYTDLLFDMNRTGEFAQKYPRQWSFRITRGAGLGKAIMPYSDAQLGDVIKGAAKQTPGRYGKKNPILSGDIAGTAKDIVNAVRRLRTQNLIGGQRFQSTSDFRAEWGLDYIQTLMELQNCGGKVQLYTKVIEAVDLLASAGCEVNLSIMGRGNGYHLDKNGNPVLGVEDFSSVTGIDFEKALAKTQQYDNVQMILVGLNDTHIRLALEDGRIGFVIPWHASGSSEDTLRTLMGSVNEKLHKGTNYEGVQEDKVIDFKDKAKNEKMKAMRQLRKDIVMKKLGGGLSKEQKSLLAENPWLNDLYRRFYLDKTSEEYKCKLSSEQASKIFPYEYWDKSLRVEDADENGRRFQEYCASLGLKPRFSGMKQNGEWVGDFTQDKGYWKLLIDRKMYNNDGTYHEAKVIDVTNISLGNMTEADMGDVPLEVNSNSYKDRELKALAVRDSIRALDERQNDTKLVEPGGPAATETVPEAQQKPDIESAADDENNPKVIRQGSSKDPSYSTDLFSKNISEELKANMATFFSGSGTVDFALRSIVHHEFAVEYDAKIAAVYKANNGDNIYVDDVRNVDIDKHKGRVEYFHASPVCKNFSNAKNNGEEQELDIETAKATADAIDTLQPKVVTVENVARYKNSKAIKLIEDALRRNGYEFDKGVYRASDFGGATIRERMFLRAVKDGVLPKIDTSQYKPVSWWNAVSDLIAELPKAELPEYMQKRMELTGLDLKKLKHPIFLLGGEKSGKLTYAPWNKPAPTILAKSTEARILMPDGRILRATPRVMARIQGLPDAFDLKDGKGGMTNAYKVVGNGVPVQLTQGIVGPLLEQNLIQPKSEKTGIKYSSDLNLAADSSEEKATDSHYSRSLFSEGGETEQAGISRASALAENATGLERDDAYEMYVQGRNVGEKKLKKLKDKQTKRAAVERLMRRARRLKAMRKKGTPVFQSQVDALIGDLDLISPGLRKSRRNALLDLQKQVDAQAALDENYAKYHATKYADLFKRLELKHASYMDLNDIVELSEAMLALEHSKWTYDKEIRDKNGQKFADQRRKGVEQQARIKSLKDISAIRAFFRKYSLNMLNPVRAGRYLDGYQHDGVFTRHMEEINEGQTKAANFRMKVDKLFEKINNNWNFVKTLGKQNIEIDTLEGKAYISKGMRIALYLSLGDTKDLKHPSDNIRHIALGGLTIPDEKLYRKGKIKDAYEAGKRVHFAEWSDHADEDTAAAIKKIVAEMTPEEKEYAKACEVFFNQMSKEAINETSKALDGYEKALVDYYFPITSDPNFLQSNGEDLVLDATLEGAGWLKERVNGRNPVLLEDASRVVLRQRDAVSKYYGLAIPIRNFNGFYKSVSDEYKTSMKEALGKTWLSYGQKYIDDMLTDLQFGRQTEGSKLDAFKSAYAGSVLSMNLGTAIKQSSSYPFAASVIGWGPIVKAAGKVIKKADYDYMDSITPWGYMRRVGLSGTEMGEVAKTRSLMDNNKVWQRVRQTLDLIRRVDVKTTDTLFFACEEYVSSKYPDLEVRGEEYNAKLAEVYNEVLQRTQPSYDVMQRNAFLRSKSDLTRIAGMFKTQTFNMGGEIIEAGARWKAAAEYAKQDASYKKDVEQARKEYARTVAATIVSQMMLAVLTAAANVVLHKVKDYRDEEGVVTSESVLAKIMKDFAQSFVGMTFLGSETQDIALSVIGNKTWYDIDYPGLDMINDTITATVKLSQETKKALAGKGSKKDVAKQLGKTALEAFKLKGVPAQNLYNLVNTVYLYGQEFVDEEPDRFDAGEGLFGLSDTSVTKDQYAMRAAAAYNAGDTASGDKWAAKTTKKKLNAAMYGDLGIDSESSEAMVEFVKDGGTVEDYNKGKDLATEMAAKKDDIEESYAYVFNSKDYTPEQKVGWLRSKTSIMKSKGYNAWKDAGGTDFDFLKHMSYLKAFDGDDKQEKVITYIKNQTTNEGKRKALWKMAGYDEDKYAKNMK